VVEIHDAFADLIDIPADYNSLVNYQISFVARKGTVYYQSAMIVWSSFNKA